MEISSELPTVFARNLGIHSGLLLEQKNGVDYSKLNDLRERMVYFQQMAVTCTIEDCLAVYFGMELTDEQLSVLKLIYRTTKPWMTGHIVGVCLERIGNTRTQNKDFAESVKVLVEQLKVEESGVLHGRMAGIAVKSTRRDAADKKEKKEKKKGKKEKIQLRAVS